MDYTRYYLKWHQDTPEHQAAMQKFYQRTLASYLPEDRGVSVLDVGCGMGFALLALQAMGFQNVAGVEQDEGQAASCRRKGLAVDLTSDTIQYLRERPGAFGLVLALDVLEHVPVAVQLEFVEAIHGALRPGGTFVCTVPNANSAVASRWRYNDWTHSSSFTEHSLDFLLFNGGFDPITVGNMEFIERPQRVWLPVGGARHWWALCLVRLVRRIEMMAELGPQQGREVPLGLNLIASATKKPR